MGVLVEVGVGDNFIVLVGVGGTGVLVAAGPAQKHSPSNPQLLVTNCPQRHPLGKPLGTQILVTSTHGTCVTGEEHQQSPAQAPGTGEPHLGVPSGQAVCAFFCKDKFLSWMPLTATRRPVINKDATTITTNGATPLWLGKEKCFFIFYCQKPLALIKAVISQSPDLVMAIASLSNSLVSQ